MNITGSEVRMKKLFQRVKNSADRNPLRNDRGDISIYTCFFVVGLVLLVSFLPLYDGRMAALKGGKKGFRPAALLRLDEL